MAQSWSIPEKFLEKCFSCRSPLRQQDYERCGVSLNSEPEGFFFDYKCPNCGYRGRYVHTTKADKGEVLRCLANYLGSKEQKGMGMEILNKIHGVNDLLRLSETDVHREVDDEDEAGFGRPGSP